MRPFLVVFIGKVFSPGTRPWRSEDTPCLAQEQTDLVRARAPLSFRLAPLQDALASRYLSLSLNIPPLYLRMPVEIYRRSRCSFRFNLLQRRLLFRVRLRRLMLFLFSFSY